MCCGGQESMAFQQQRRVLPRASISLAQLHDLYLTQGVAWGSVANGTLHLSALAAIASVLFELTQSTPTSPLMLSHMTTALLVAVPLPQGDVTVKFLNVMFSQMAFGLELHVSDATTRPYLPEV